MNLLRKLTLIAGTGAVALGAGHFVQQKAESRAAADGPGVVVSDIRPVAAGPGALAPATILVDPSALPPVAPPAAPQPDVLAAADPDLFVMPDAPAMTAPVMASAPDCGVSLDLLPQPGATIGISLLAPCHPDQRVVLNHAGLTVTARTSASGALVSSLPALKAVAQVDVIFADGERAQDTVALADFAGVQRFAVQWQAEDAFQLHAFENGARYGHPGHISSAFSGTTGETGLVTVLGDASVDLPLQAEVYTFGLAAKTEIVLEAAITQSTCGREVLGEAILAVNGSVKISDLTLAMPGCDAVGDILVLKNLLEDMTLATAN
ncbi:hypothetical protein EEB11_10235 [Pseudotabrizicola sediminis]|uniref:Translocase n=1 Tax=Pseudotabrizicola sediminis TaxID=2486418 RepID=A0ABY2KL07_9RHOB|nr:hypothetical protein [Pseudotabrizicola sediminis]TGD43194.1 hypothetical protein EEB11_10235 [Pseudotabrizicola sediminis]